MAQRIPKVNAGKYSRILGISENRNDTNSELTIANLSPMVLTNICGRLQTNDVISVFNYQRPIFDNVAKEGLSRAVQRHTAEHLRIYLEWNNEIFQRVVDLLDANVRRLTIIGMGNLITEDIDKIYHLLTLCPNISSLQLRNINTPLIQQGILERLPSLVRIDLRFSPIPITLCLHPNIMEFICCIGPGDCRRCIALGDVRQSWFLKFYEINQHIRLVFMHFTDVECDRCKKRASSFRNEMDARMARHQARDGIVRRFMCNL